MRFLEYRGCISTQEIKNNVKKMNILQLLELLIVVVMLWICYYVNVFLKVY